MAVLRPPKSVARDEFGELSAMWIEGLNASHAPGCVCGGMAMAAPDPLALEDDLLFYLKSRYTAARLDDLVAFLGERHAADRNTRDFETWLAGLSEAPLAPDHRARLVADLRTFLDSFAGRARGGFGVCY